MPILAINDTTISYETYGQGFPLVYLKGGFGGLGTGRDGQVPAWVDTFSKSFEVILYDRRSSGLSGYPESPHTMHLLASDLSELIRQLGHERAHVWGTSAAGPICLQFGFDFPDQAQSLAISDSAPWFSRDEAMLAKLRRRISILESQGSEAAYQDRKETGMVGLNLFTGGAPADKNSTTRSSDQAIGPSADDIRDYLASLSRDERIAKYAGELRNFSAYLDWDGTDQLQQLSMPVLILYGTADRIFPNAEWQFLCQDQENMHYIAYPGVDHGGASGPAAHEDILTFLRDNTP